MGNLHERTEELVDKNYDLQNQIAIKDGQRKKMENKLKESEAKCKDLEKKLKRKNWAITLLLLVLLLVVVLVHFVVFA